MIKKVKKIKKFFNETIWVENKNRHFLIKILYKFLQIATYSIKGFRLDKCNLHASSLTFFSILSIVPIIALSVGIAKNFGLENAIESAVKKNLIGQEEVVDYIIDFSNSMIINAEGGIIAAISMLVLFWSIVRLLNRIESAFNAIWNVNTNRTVFRKIRNYVSIIIFTPISIILSLGITVFVSRYLKNNSESYEVIKIASPVIVLFIKFFPYLLLWLLFIMIYYTMPNAKVNFKAALVAGIVAGSLYQTTQWGYINFSVGMIRKYDKIYGSFAAIPLFFIWVRIAWMIVLFGGEISYALHKKIIKIKT